MSRYFNALLILCFLALPAVPLVMPAPAAAASAAQIERDARRALQKLYDNKPKALILGERSKGILVFPSITKGGFIIGGQIGEGVLFLNGRAAAYYSTISASYGLQAGIQKYGYALFFMTEKDLDFLNKTGGWELGTAPSIVIADEGIAGGISTTSTWVLRKTKSIRSNKVCKSATDATTQVVVFCYNSRPW